MQMPPEYLHDTKVLEVYLSFRIFMEITVRRYLGDRAAAPTFDNRAPHRMQFEFAGSYGEIAGDSPCRCRRLVSSTAALSFG